MSDGARTRVVVIAGTATGVGKTHVASALAAALVARGTVVVAKKPVQSYADGSPTDAAILASVTGQAPSEVCPERWSYPIEMAPPIAAKVLGRPAPSLSELAGFVSSWPLGTEIGLIEGAGGVRSPIATDGDLVDLINEISPDVVVLVADAGLGVINAVRLSSSALDRIPIVFLNRYEEENRTHRESRAYLIGLGPLVVSEIEELVAAVI